MKSYLINKDEMSKETIETLDYWMEKIQKHTVPSPGTVEEFKNIKKYMENNLVTKDLFEAKFESLKEFIGGKFDDNKEDHSELNTKVTATNGRVKRLEIWRAYLLGAWAVVTIIFPILFFYFISVTKQDLKDEMNKEVEAKIGQYIIKDK